jgi:hypothetical protein
MCRRKPGSSRIDATRDRVRRGRRSAASLRYDRSRDPAHRRPVERCSGIEGGRARQPRASSRLMRYRTSVCGRTKRGNRAESAMHARRDGRVHARGDLRTDLASMLDAGSARGIIRGRQDDPIFRGASGTFRDVFGTKFATRVSTRSSESCCKRGGLPLTPLALRPTGVSGNP